MQAGVVANPLQGSLSQIDLLEIERLASALLLGSPLL
jgi:hypothetical protein